MKIFSNIYIPIITLAALLSFISNFGSIISIIEPFTYTKINISNLGYISISTFSETFFNQNQWWRLVTPMFLHFSLPHLAFNSLWIYILGQQIEKIDGKLIFLTLVLFSSISSNFLQFYWVSSNLFGGLSGVIYGLIGYCMINEMDSVYQRYEIPPALYLFMIIWMVLGFLGLLDLFGFGSVANFAHLGGLVSGITFAIICKFINVGLIGKL
ncbi:MAG: peptidase, S54 family protein [Gammaproteobacteria bacterium]|nr:peptidase, S54 family protein [Gammaproteobacteria bacterium]